MRLNQPPHHNRTVPSSISPTPRVDLLAHLEVIAQMMAAERPDHVALRARDEPFLLGLEAERQACDAGAALPAPVDRFARRLQGCAGTTVDSAAALRDLGGRAC